MKNQTELSEMIGKAVKNRREELDIKRKDAAQMAYINVTTLDNIEAGYSCTTVVLDELLRVLGLEVVIRRVKR